jgi:hypothetical protein
MIRLDDAGTARALDVPGRDGPTLGLLDAKYSLVDIVRQRQHQRLQVADDLMHILDDTRDGLMLVENAIDAERPDRRSAERRQQHTPHRVAQRVAKTALERLEAELGNVRVVLALRRFDELRANEAGKIDRLCHVCVTLWSMPENVARQRLTPPATRGELVRESRSLTSNCGLLITDCGFHCDEIRNPQSEIVLYLEYSSTINCSCAAIGMLSRAGRSSMRPLNVSRSTAIHDSGAPRDD